MQALSAFLLPLAPYFALYLAAMLGERLVLARCPRVHEYVAIARDVWRAPGWRRRWRSFVQEPAAAIEANAAH